MIDKEGYRENVGIVICNDQRKVLWARRSGEEAWQFPQGGINKGESAEEAMYRELKEEVGLDPHNVEILARTKGWLKYDVPKSWIRRDCRDRYRGQKQIWFLLRFIDLCCVSLICVLPFVAVVTGRNYSWLQNVRALVRLGTTTATTKRLTFETHLNHIFYILHQTYIVFMSI